MDIEDLTGTDDDEEDVQVGNTNPPARLAAGPAKKPPASLGAMKNDAAEVDNAAVVAKAKVVRMRARAKKSIDSTTDYDDMPDDEKADHNKNMKAISYYSKHIRKGTCEEVTDMIPDDDDGNDDWDKGQSQDMHQQILNSRAYEF